MTTKTMPEITKPKAVVRYKRSYGKERSVNFVEYEYNEERYITGTVVRGTDKSLGWYFGKGTEGLKEANRVVLLSDEEFSKAEDDKKYLWKEVLKKLTESKPAPITPEVTTGEFVRVTIKEEGKRQVSFWAKKGEETRIGNFYTRVDKEGEDFSEYKIIDGEKTLVEKKALISRGLIVKEEPAHIDRKYGEMRIGKLPLPPVTPEPKAEKGKVEAQARYKELMKPRLEAHDKEIKAVNDDFTAGKMTPKEMEEKHKAINKKTDAVAATMRKKAWGEYPETLPSRAELEKVQRMRSSRSRASDSARRHSVVISPDNPKVATWLHDQGTADISGIDTPRLTRKAPRITPKRPRLRR